MNIFNKRRLLKATIYRIASIIIAQVVCWGVTKSFKYNAVVLIADIVQTVWYYAYEIIWKKSGKNGRKS